MANSGNLAQFIPKGLLNLIRDRIKSGIVDAEAKYSLNQDEEDAITGALGQAISTTGWMEFRSNEGDFTYEIKSYKLRGRGPDAPEKRLGADAIFQVAVFKGGQRIFGKGLPFQAKKGGGFQNAEVKRQAADLLRTSGTGIVVRYSEKGYSAVDVRDLVNAEGVQIAVELQKPKSLATMLGDDFIECRIGRLGLFFDPTQDERDGKGVWAISTHIVQLPRI